MPNYIQDPNNSKKQVPGPQPDNYYTRLSQLTQCTLAKSPNYVLVTTTMQDPFGFFFGSSASFAAEGMDISHSSNYEIIKAGTPAGTKLDFHPMAWSGSVRDAGQIQFVYKGGLDGSGRP